MQQQSVQSPVSRTRFVAVMAAFFASWWVVRPIWDALGLEGPLERAVPMLIPAAATYAFVRTMTGIAPRNPALRRYGNGLLVCLLGYMALLVAANFAETVLAPTSPAMIAVAIAPALPMLACLGVIGRYFVEEPDEYQRMLAVRASLVGTGVLLAAAMVWEALQQAGLVAPAHAGLAFVVWCAGFGIGRVAQWRPA